MKVKMYMTRKDRWVAIGQSLTVMVLCAVPLAALGWLVWAYWPQ
jgi:hypothetical protein